MPLSWNEIKDRALRFSREWAGTTSERAESQTFWNEFFAIFGVDRRRVAVFEQKAKRFAGTRHGRIDVFWPGVMLAEHKSGGRDLDAAFDQATDYFAGLADAELPRHVVVSDFARFRVYDLETGEPPEEFALADLQRHVRRFGFIAGYQVRTFKEEDPVNVQAAERMGRLHDALKAAGYEGHALEVLLVRLLFCLFADDTGIFPRHAFHDLVAQRTGVDGGDLGGWPRWRAAAFLVAIFVVPAALAAWLARREGWPLALASAVGTFGAQGALVFGVAFAALGLGPE